MHLLNMCDAEARRVVNLAREEAMECRSKTVSTAHLMMAFSRAGGQEASFLEGQGVTADALRKQWSRFFNSQSKKKPKMGDISLSPNCVEIFDAAFVLYTKNGGIQISKQQVFEALLSKKGKLHAQLLMSLGCKPSDVESNYKKTLLQASPA